MGQSRTGSAFLLTLTLLFGLQVFRVFLPTTIWYLGGYFNTEQLALYALATFSLTLLAPLLRRWLGERGALTLAIGGLVLVRLAIQFVRAPQIDLALATAGIGLWGWFIALWNPSPHNCPRQGDLPTLTVVFPLTFLFDTGSRSLLLSYDLAWRRDGLATLLVVGLVGLALALLWRERRAFAGKSEAPVAQEPSLGRALPLLGLGPWLYVTMSITHNPLALTASTGWGDVPAHLAVNVLTALGAIACVLVAGRSALQHWFVAFWGGVLLSTTLAFIVVGIEPGGLWLGLASLSSWAALGQVLTSAARPAPLRPGSWRSSVIVFLSLVILLVIVIMVTVHDILWMKPVAGVILTLAALWATRVKAGRDQANLRAKATLVGAVAVAVLATVGVWGLLNRSPPVVKTPPTRPLRVMSYNIHQGLDADNRMDLQAISDVIAAENPDIVVLNEVNRARAGNGFVDTLALISRRMNMRYVFGANYQDGQYGNALLSRYPILAWDNIRYTHDSTEIRGLLWVVVQTSGGPLTFYATHLDHVSGPEHARTEQVNQALAIWAGNARAVLLGDLNAEPDAPELRDIYAAGFVDVLAATGQDDVFTSWDPDSRRRIDYIFLTPDLSPDRAWVVPSRVSDHLPVLVEIEP